MPSDDTTSHPEDQSEIKAAELPPMGFRTLLPNRRRVAKTNFYEWTVEEDKILTERYPKEGSQDSLAKDLPRKTKSQIGTRARKLGIYVNREIFWSNPNRIDIRTKDITGQQFNDLTVLSFTDKDQNGRHYYLCKCKCGDTKITRKDYLTSGGLKSCGCRRNKSRRENYHDLSHRYLTAIEKRSKKNGIEFSLTMEFMWLLFERQNKKCAISGQDIVLCKSRSYKTQTASLDKIDPLGGYVEENVQWVHKDVNTMKMDFDQTYFIETCRKIAEHNRT